MDKRRGKRFLLLSNLKFDGASYRFLSITPKITFISSSYIFDWRSLSKSLSFRPSVYSIILPFTYKYGWKSFLSILISKWDEWRGRWWWHYDISRTFSTPTTSVVEWEIFIGFIENMKIFLFLQHLNYSMILKNVWNLVKIKQHHFDG